ncbi:MAG: hypothetical protein Q9212_002518 [Teloschistes hypoglaucus]
MALLTLRVVSTFHRRLQSHDNSSASGLIYSTNDAEYATSAYHGFTNTSTNIDAHALSDAQIQAAQQNLFPATTPFPSYPIYGVPQSSFSEVASPQNPVVTDWNPSQGTQGTPLSIYIESDRELAPSSFLVFASRQCPAILKKLDSKSLGYSYFVTSHVPAFSVTGSCNSQVPMFLQVKDYSGQYGNTMFVGYFQYADRQCSIELSPYGIPRKRRLSTASADSSAQIAKRAVSQQLFSRNSQASPLSSIQRQQMLPQSSVPSPQSAHQYQVMARLQNLQPSIHGSSPSGYSNDDAMQETWRKRSSTVCGVPDRPTLAPTPQWPGWNSSFAAINGPGGMASVLSKFPSSMVAPPPVTSVASGPAFFRTSILPTLQKERQDCGGPYPVHAQKASVIIDGDLNSMVENWTPAESAAGRRLVRFSRWQQGSTIHTTFEPVAREDYVPNSACISCIRYGREKGEFWTTSVDTINLIEKIVDDEFSTPEKNRVRRNIEGFGPETVSKPKDENFFKLIMRFEDPKPRNIAKDIKAFNWRNLDQAITKVVGKYVSHSLLAQKNSSLTIHPSYLIQSAIFYSPSPGRGLNLTSTTPRSDNSSVYAPTSRPYDHSHSHSHSHSHNNSTNNNQDYAPSPAHSTTYSTTNSSSYSSNTPSYQSSTTSPNISHAVSKSQPEPLSQSSLIPGYERQTLQASPLMYEGYPSYSTAAAVGVGGEEKYNPGSESFMRGQQGGGFWAVP